jgi:hypothetical protein
MEIIFINIMIGIGSLIFVIRIFFPSIFSNIKDTKFHLEKKSYEISTIDTQINYKGDFCLATGIINNEEYYQFYEKRNDNKWYRISIPVKKISIIEIDGNPCINYFDLICTINYKNGGTSTHIDSTESIEIHVPKKSVIKRYNS